jgi:hypothetical protein
MSKEDKDFTELAILTLYDIVDYFYGEEASLDFWCIYNKEGIEKALEYKDGLTSNPV